MPVDVTEKYIRIRMQNPSLFEKDSFRTINISTKDGIKAIIGKKKGKDKTEVQSYLFSKKNGWTVDKAKKWIKDHKQKSSSELLLEGRSFVTANLMLCSKLPNLELGNSDIKRLKKKDSTVEAAMNKYFYFYAESVHEGLNKNGDYFFKDELVQNYNTMSHNPLDWEHDRTQILGFSLDALLVSQPEELLAVGFNGVINRLSPYVTVEERTADNKFITRDEIIKNRFFEGKLFLSMEVMFDAFRCTKCGLESNDIFEFEHHMYMSHQNDDAFRGLVGIDFIGNGIVETPADPNADVFSLRTDDSGVIEDILDAGFKEKHGCFSSNIYLAQKVAFENPDDELIEKKDLNLIFASDVKNNADLSTKTATINDNSNKVNKKDKPIIGEDIMFKLMEKVSELNSLSEIFHAAHVALKDFKGEKELTEESIVKFNEELIEVINSKLKENSFSVNSVFTLTDEEKLNAITEARKEEKKASDIVINDIKTELDNMKTERDSLSNEVELLKTKIAELETAEKNKEVEAKINEFIDGMNIEFLTDSMRNRLYKMAMNNVKDGGIDEEALKEFAEDIKISFNQAALIKASGAMGGGSVGGDGASNDLGKELDTISKEYKTK